MKSIKQFALVCVLVLTAVLLVGCGGGTGGGGGGEIPADFTIETLKTSVTSTFEKYATADNGAYKLIISNEQGESTFESIFNFEEEQCGVISLKYVLTTEEGTISLYVQDEVGYMNMYDEFKTSQELDLDLSEEIAMDYNFSRVAELIVGLISPSFFESATLASYENNVATINLNIGTYNIDIDNASEDLISIFDGIKESLSVSVSVTLDANNEVTNVKFNVVNESTETIELQLLGISDTEIEIDFPDFSDYE